MDQHYGSPTPSEEEDSYETPLSTPVEPRPSSPPSINYRPSPSAPNEYEPPVTENSNPFTQSPDPLPFQTTFTPGVRLR